jgi:hypothetical protein
MTHFPGQNIPAFRLTSPNLPDPSGTTGQEKEEAQDGDGDQDRELGWYHDGVKRTLTDEQIAMFRHSEIHRLLQQKQIKCLTAKTKEGSKRTEQTKIDMKQPQSKESPACESNHIELEDWQEKDRAYPITTDQQTHG